MDIDHAISVINDMCSDWYGPPTKYYGPRRVIFIQRSYAHSAIKEIKRCLMGANEYSEIRYKNKDPFDLIEDFRKMVDYFAGNTKNGDTKFMFSVYYDVATDVLDILINEQKFNLMVSTKNIIKNGGD